MITKPLEFNPEYDGSKYKYLAPDHTLWNISKVINNMVQLWTVNAWGQLHTQSVNLYEFMQTWKEREG